MYNHPLAMTGITAGAALFWYPLAVFALISLAVALWHMVGSLRSA